MIERLISLSIRHRVAVIALTLASVAFGIAALARLNVDAFPDLMPNQVQVMTEAPGLSPLEVEQLVSYPLETAMLGLPRAADVRSISKAGISVVTVTFDDDVDFYFARTQTQQRIQEAAELLPSGLMPMLGPPATAMGEVFQYLVESPTHSLFELRNIHEYTIKPLLRSLPDVAEVNTWGGMVQQYQVLVDPNALAGYGLTVHEVESALAANNANFGAGYVESRGERYTVRGLGRITTAEDIGNVVVKTTAAGTPIYVSDVARVEIGASQREGAASRDTIGEAVSGTVIMRKGANGKRVVSSAEERLDEIRRILPAGVSIRPYYSQGDVVDRTTATVFRNLIEGGLLVALVLLLFLRNWRASAVVVSVIPISLLLAFIAMRQFGISANLMSLGALDFGLVVDGAVVMVENFVRRLAQDPSRSDRSDLIRRAGYEVARPVVFGIFIIVAVYVPIFTLTGLEGRMFKPMAFTVCAAVLGSLLLALTYVPAISSYVLHGADEHPPRWFERLRGKYAVWLDRALANRRRVGLTAAALFTAAIVSLPFIGSEFMPKLDEGSLLLEVRRLPSTSLPQGLAIGTEVERTLMRFPEVSSVVSKHGRPELAVETMGLYQSDVYVGFKPRKQWKTRSLEELIVKMDSALSEIPGLDFNFSAPMAMRLDEVISGVRTDLGIKVFGDSLPVLQAIADRVSDVTSGVRGAEDVSVDVSAGAMQLEIDVDRRALARNGLSIEDLRAAVAAGVAGVEATEVIEGRRRFPVVVRLSEEYRSSPEALNRLVLWSPSGARIELSQVARVRIAEGPERIVHENGGRSILVQSNVRGRDLGGFVADVRREIERRVQLPPGYFIQYSGQFANQERASRRLALVVPLVLGLILTFLYFSFGNARQALLVLLNVPFAFVGGIAALWLRGLNINLSASIGFIALFGVAMLNGIVLVTYINKLRGEGGDLRASVRKASLVRLRPVLMTALVASFGFIPMALSTTSGSEVQRPLATVVIGGLITSTVLTLIVLPVAYEWIEERWPALVTSARRIPFRRTRENATAS